MIINHNLPGMNAINRMNANSATASKSMQKLSSGLRINTAADDAAGLAISEKMRGQIRGLDQASSNAQDAISLIQTGEGALNETQSILQRMRELSIQAANDTNTTADRGSVQQEMNQLTSEINRIGNTTEFNTKKILDGSFNFSAAATGKTVGTAALAQNIDIKNTQTNGTVTAASYGAAGNTATKATSASATGNVTINELSAITTGNNELTLKIDGKQYDITLAAQTGTKDIIDELNTQLQLGPNSEAIAKASLNEDNQIVITSLTKGSTGSVEIVGGNFADSLLAKKSSVDGTLGSVPIATTAGGTKKDYMSVDLQGADGQTYTVKLNAVDNATGENTATTFKIGTNTATGASNIRESLAKAIEANDQLKGRYSVTGTGSNFTVTAANVGDGYSISKFTFKPELGQETGSTIATGSTTTAPADMASVKYEEGKDISDVSVHSDVAASTTGSKVFTNTGLGTSNLVVGPTNNELTYSIDGEETTITMANKTYNGTTATVKASNTAEITANAADTNDFTVELTGADGTLATLSLNANAAATSNSATDFMIGSDITDTTSNIAASLQKAIDADDKFKGLFSVSVQNGNQITVTATKATSDLAVGNIAGVGGGFAAGVTDATPLAGDEGTSVETLVNDLQTKMDAQVYSTTTDTISAAATNAADAFIAKFEKADGTQATITLNAAAGGAGVSDATDATHFDMSGTDDQQTLEIAKALNLAIAANDDLKGKYEASALNGKLTIKSLVAGDGHKIDTAYTSTGAFSVNAGATGGATVIDESTADAQKSKAATVSIDSGSNLMITSNNTGAGSNVQVTGGNLADSLFGAVATRMTSAVQTSNDTLSFNVDGESKTINVAKQTYQDLDEFISVNKDAFTTAGVTASNENGKLSLTSNTTGKDSKIDTVATGDLSKQLGLVKADGTQLDASNFVQGADGNFKLDFKLDGGSTTYTAELQVGSYTDTKVLAAAVESAMNNAIKDAGGTGTVTASIDASGKLSVASTTDGAASKVEFTSNSEADAAGILKLNGSVAEAGKDQQAKELTFQIGANNGQSMGVTITDMRANALGVSGKTADAAASVDGAAYTQISNVTDGTNSSTTEFALDVSDATKAAAASKVIDSALEKVSAERSKLGAYQNRLEHTINNLGTSSENLTSAESRIRDVDMAKEMATFSKNNILAQAAQAMLAQANQQPQQVLQLLR